MNGYNSNYFNRSSMKNLRTSIQNMVLEDFEQRQAERRQRNLEKKEREAKLDALETQVQQTMRDISKPPPTSGTRPGPIEDQIRLRALAIDQLQQDTDFVKKANELGQSVGQYSGSGSAGRFGYRYGTSAEAEAARKASESRLPKLTPQQKAQAEANRRAIADARSETQETKPRFGVGTGSYGQPIITGGSYVNPNSPEARLRDQGWTPGSDGKLTPPDPEKDEHGYLNTPTGRAAAMRDAKADTQRQYDALKDASQGLNDQQFDSMVSGYRRTGRIAVPPSINTGGKPTFMGPYGSKFQPSTSREIPDLLRAPEPEQKPNLGLGTPSPGGGGGPLMGPPGIGLAARTATSILAPGGVARGRPVINRRPTPKPTTIPRMFER